MPHYRTVTVKIQLQLKNDFQLIKLQHRIEIK